MLAFSLLIDLTIRSVLQDIPRDASAIVVYLLLGLFAALMLASTRSRTREGPPSDTLSGATAGEDPENAPAPGPGKASGPPQK